jgi:hydrogenase/urease accessory protein HupE
MRPLLRKIAWVFAALLALPGVASAHAPVEGLGSFYNGLLHPLFVPSHLLPLIALGLLCGQQGVMKAPALLISFCVAILAGLVAAVFVQGFVLEAPLLAGAAVIGILIAVRPRIPAGFLVALAVVIGFLVGLDSVMEGLAGKEKMAGLIGSGISAYLLPLYPMALVEWIHGKTRMPWLQIGVRVLGSWIAASALLVLSLSLFAPKG